MTIFTETGCIEKDLKVEKKKKRAQYKIDLSMKTIFGMFIKMKGLGPVLEAFEVKKVKNIL